MAELKGYQFLLFYLFQFCSVVSAGYVALMDAESEGTKPGEQHSHTLCVNYQPLFSTLPSADEANPMLLVDLSNKAGCSQSDFDYSPQNFTGSAVAVARGNCSFTKKADLAQAVNVSSILIIDYKNSKQLPVPSANNSKDYNEIKITVASVTWNDYQDVVALPAPVEVKIYAIKSSHFDPNMIVIMLGSTSIIIIAALCSIRSERRHNNSLSIQSRKNRSQNREADEPNSSSSETQSESSQVNVEITPMVVFFWVIFLVGILLLLYFFYDYAVYIFIVVFCIVGSHGLYSCLLPIWSRVFPFRYEFPQKWMLCFKGNIKITSFLLLLVCFAIGIFWVVQRHASYAWIFQDILGTAFCISLLRSLRLPSLKIITLIMVLLFCYDVFFVFITPLITKDGESIMVDVATGGKGQHSEMVPLVFIIPLLSHHPASICTGRPFSILGFGDVIFPGILIVYNAVFDVNKMVYFVASSIGYFVGMGGCLVALVFMESGQPALFYLVPATLIPTYLIALKRGELRAIWSGKMSPVVNKCEDSTPNSNNACDTAEHANDETFDEEVCIEENSPLMH